jgi:HD domain
VLTTRFDEAFRYARHLHQNQLRKGTAIPYISHLMAVSVLVVEHGGDENQAIAGLLHDAAEDQGGAATLAEIRLISAMRSPTSWLIARTPGPNQSRHGVRARKHISMFCSINRKRLYWCLSRTRRTTLRPSCLIIARWGRHCGIDSMAVPMGLAGTMASFPASSLGPYREACPTDCRARCRGFPTEAAKINLRFVALAP